MSLPLSQLQKAVEGHIVDKLSATEENPALQVFDAAFCNLNFVRD